MAKGDATRVTRDEGAPGAGRRGVMYKERREGSAKEKEKRQKDAPGGLSGAMRSRPEGHGVTKNGG